MKCGKEKIIGMKKGKMNERKMFWGKEKIIGERGSLERSEEKGEGEALLDLRREVKIGNKGGNKGEGKD